MVISVKLLVYPSISHPSLSKSETFEIFIFVKKKNYSLVVSLLFILFHKKENIKENYFSYLIVRIVKSLFVSL